MSSNGLPGADTYMVDDRDPQIQYSAGWSDEGVNEEFNGTTRFATTAGVSINVFGTIDSLGARANPTYTLDDTPPFRFTARNTSSVLYQQLFYESPVLENSSHVLVVAVADEGSRYFFDFLVVRMASPRSTSSTTPSRVMSSTSTLVVAPSASTLPDPSDDTAGMTPHNNVGAIVGGVVGGVGFILLLLVLLCLSRRWSRSTEGLQYAVAPLRPPLDVERNDRLVGNTPHSSNGRLDTRSSPPTSEVTSELITRNQPPTDPPSALNMKGSQHPVHALTIPSSPMQTSASAQPSSRAVTTRYLKNSVGVDVDVNEPPPAYSRTTISVFGTVDGLGPNGPPNSSYVLDGTNPVRFSGPRTGGILYQQLFYQSPTLPNLEHTLQVTVLDEGSRYFLDFLAVRSPPQPTITSSSTSTTPSATESSPARSDSAGSSSGSSTNVGAIVGGVVGGVAFLLLLAGLLWWFRRKRSTSTDPRGDMDYAGPQTTFAQSHLRSNSTSNYPPDAAASVSVFTPLTDNEMHHARPQPFLESRQSFDTSSLSTSYNNLGAPSVLGASSLQTQVQPFSALASTPVAGSTTGSGYGSKGAVHLTHTPTQQQHQSNPSYARSDSAAGEDQPPPAYGG
ncbi:hypothetical protein ONZ45_g1247 [Pleurotus djamor]|nr:hypothetical protein ONZ45_g1247 [Pleurotus djamor]